jgi:type I restriction enzyme S subunit
MTAPEKWLSQPLENIAHLTMGQSPDSRFYTTDESWHPFLQGCAEFGRKTPIPNLYCQKLVKIGRKGSILFSVRAPVGKINIADQDYVIGRGLAAIEGDKVDSGYLSQYLRFITHAFRNASQGSTFESINSNTLGAWPIAFPRSNIEQKKIAEVLASVDLAIEQTEALIAKQQRIKTGLMQDLLTRGIDEHGQLRTEVTHAFKDSLLGRIPVEWKVSPAENLCLAVIDCKNRTPPATMDGHPVIRTPNVRHGEFVFDGLAWTDEKSYEIWVARGKPRVGDVVITREAPYGEACQIPPNIPLPCLGQRMMMYQTDPTKLRSDYLVFALYSQAVQTRLFELAGGSTVGHIKVGDIRTLPIPHPVNIAEQKLISLALSKASTELKELVEQKNKFTSVKTALMQDLLTGRKRVTNLLEPLAA